MDAKMKSIWNKLIFPHWIIKILLVLLSTVLLVYSFAYEDANEIIAYISYLLSAYSLIIVSIGVPKIVKGIRTSLYKNKYCNRYLTEHELRARLFLNAGFMINLLYALFTLGAGVFYHSVWLGAISVYYMILSFMRFELVRKERRCLQYAKGKERRIYELKSCLFCGCMMFLLNIAVSGLVIQLIWKNQYYSYPGVMIYAQAAYAFYAFSIAIVNMVKYWKMERPILSAAKMISFACALTSILALQTAMLVQFGEQDKSFMMLMNSLTGGAVCFSVFVMAIWLVYKTRKEMRIIMEMNDEYGNAA